MGYNRVVSCGSHLPQLCFIETAGDCSAHLINEGLTVGASGAVSVQWQATGPTAANRNTDFRCTLDDNAPVNCT